MRFFFHLYEDSVSTDEEGRDLPSVQAAHEVALECVREVMCEEMRQNGRLVLHHRIEVEDEEGSQILVLPFGAAVTIEP